MKLRLVTTICTIASAMMAAAQVPSLINYQGRLTDADGAPVTGSKNFSISIYDAATAGNLLYTETIGAVSLDANGVYSFQFGSAGTSNKQVTETVATTNGTGTTFQKVLANSPVVAGSVSVTDGTYTWSQSTGSSNEDDFGVAYSTSLRRVTVNYYNGAPAAGRTITATYRYGTSGITGALSSGAEHWMAVSVDGTPQATRQRVLAVPFAAFSSKAAFADSIDESSLMVPTSTLSKLIDEVAFSGVNSSFYRTEDFPSGPSGRNGTVALSSLELAWDDATDSITTRALGYSVQTANTQTTWPLNGFLESVSVYTGFSTLRNSANVKFIYSDDTSSDDLQIAGGNSGREQIIENPHSSKYVKSVTVSHSGWDLIGLSLRPNYQSTHPRSVTIQVANIPKSIFGLRTMINGSASAGKSLSNCIIWKIVYQDDSESPHALIGEEILWSNGKIPRAVKVSTVPTQLGADTIDLSRIVVRLITKS